MICKYFSVLVTAAILGGLTFYIGHLLFRPHAVPESFWSGSNISYR